MKTHPTSMDRVLRAGVENYVEILGRAQDRLLIAGEGAQALRARGARHVAQYPLLSLAAALAAGILFGVLCDRALNSRRR